MTVAPTLNYRFSTDQYHRMMDAGVLTEADRVELINGEIVQMTPIGREHSSVVDRLAAFLFAAADGQFIVRVQNPMVMDDQSEPQPDLTVVRFRDDYYFKSLPRPLDVVLLIEVSNSSLESDRRLKVPLYAQGGIPEVWLVNIASKSLETFREPVDGEYRQRDSLKGSAKVAPLAFPARLLKLDELFPG